MNSSIQLDSNRVTVTAFSTRTCTKIISKRPRWIHFPEINFKSLHIFGEIEKYTFQWNKSAESMTRCIYKMYCEKKITINYRAYKTVYHWFMNTRIIIWSIVFGSTFQTRFIVAFDVHVFKIRSRNYLGTKIIYLYRSRIQLFVTLKINRLKFSQLVFLYKNEFINSLKIIFFFFLLLIFWVSSLLDSYVHIVTIVVMFLFYFIYWTLHNMYFPQQYNTIVWFSTLFFFFSNMLLLSFVNQFKKNKKIMSLNPIENRYQFSEFIIST